MDHRAEAWYLRRTTHWQEWPLDRLLELKQRAGSQISVVIPARNEEATVASVVGPLHRALVADAPLVDELFVIDSDSTDGTGSFAASAGAGVHRVAPEGTVGTGGLRRTSLVGGTGLEPVTSGM